MDSTRAFCMLLGIPYHASLIWAAGDWHINAGTDLSVEIFGRAISLFRMPVFFLVSGFFAALLLSRRPTGGWLRKRGQRLGIPLFFGLLIVAPINDWIAFTYEPSGPVGALVWDRMIRLRNVSHLWFLATLLQLCIAAAVFWRLGLLQRCADGFTRARSVLPAFLLLVLINEGLVFPFLTSFDLWLLDHQLVNVTGFLLWAPWFLFGCVLLRDERLRKAVLRLTPANILLGVLVPAAFLICYAFNLLPELGADLLAAAARIFLSRLFLSLMFVFIDREHRLTQRFVALSFTIYIVHVPIILLLARLVSSLAPPLGFLSVTLGCLLLSYGVALLVERSPLLSFMFNGVSLRPHVRRRELFWSASSQH